MTGKLLSAAALVAAGLLSVSAWAQSDPVPRFVVVPNHYNRAPHNPSNMLPLWSGHFSDQTHKTVTYTMVGTNPSQTNTTTTVPVVVVPLKMVYGSDNGHMTFDPNAHKVSNGETVTRNTLNSPLFHSGIDFVQGGVDLGNTQYIDAFQRGNFWSLVKSRSSYHVLLGTPTVLPERTIDVPIGQGYVMNNPYGTGKVGTMTLTAFDAKVQSLIGYLSARINPGVLPLFLTYNVFLTDRGSCCIGGYHSANGGAPGGQTYIFATYATPPGAFAQDVSAFSHEIGEWMDDPFVNNKVNCQAYQGLLEVGDPLTQNPNYGAYPYTFNDFTYNLQSLVFLDYFGAPRSYRVNSWYSFQDEEQGPCPGQ